MVLKQQDAVQEYRDLLERLRGRFNVLNTSMFLLEQNLPDVNPKTSKYMRQIHREIKHIRKLMHEYPESGQDDK